MSGRAWWLSALGVIAWLGACSSDGRAPGALADDSGSSVSGGHFGSIELAGAPSSAESGGAPSAGQGGEAIVPLPIGQIIGGDFAGPSTGGAPSPEPLCDPEARWKDAQPLAGVSTEAGDERLLGMTHDERTLVFERGDALWLAERASADVDFSAPTALTLPAGYSASRGLALGPNGVSLVLVREGGLGFAELTRSGRGAAFGAEPSDQRFRQVNEARMFSGGELSSPVLSEDGTTFFYVVRSVGRSDVWRATGDALSERTLLDPVSLGADGDLAKLTLSITADSRTLFLFDEALGHVVGLWSATPAAELTRAVPFADLESAFTNADCSRLYGTRARDGSRDVVMETPH